MIPSNSIHGELPLLRVAKYATTSATPFAKRNIPGRRVKPATPKAGQATQLPPGRKVKNRDEQLPNNVADAS